MHKYIAVENLMGKLSVVFTDSADSRLTNKAKDYMKENPGKHLYLCEVLKDMVYEPTFITVDVEDNE